MMSQEGEVHTNVLIGAKLCSGYVAVLASRQLITLRSPWYLT
jgi:hypothetical protein